MDNGRSSSRKQFLVIRIMKKTIGRFVSDGLKMEESLSQVSHPRLEAPGVPAAETRWVSEWTRDEGWLAPNPSLSPHKNPWLSMEISCLNF